MATVYLARDLRHDRLVAVKILRPELAQTLGPERFLKEIRIIARMSHPNILPLHDSGEFDGSLCYVMPYVEGESLRGQLDRTGPLPVRDALRIAREVADALGYAHTRGIVHRDIKPENILVAAGHAVVSDFGIAQAVDAAGASRLTATGVVIGTPSYMSPEQATGAALDGRSDLYSLGCVLYEMLAGAPPHSGPTAPAIIARRLTEPPPSIRTTRDQVPEAIDRAISTAMALNPDERFATAAEFIEALETITTGSAPISTAPPRRRSRLLKAVAAGIVLVAIGLLGWWQLGQRSVNPALTRLAILPFSVGGDTGFEYLGEGIVDLLARNLDGAGDLRTVDPGTMLAALAREGERDEQTRRFSAAARRVGAGLYLVGRVHAIRGKLQIQAGLFDVGAEAADAISQVRVEGDTADALALVDQLAARLLVERRPGAPGRLFETAALTTRSIAGLKAFLTAEQNLRSGPERIDSAIAGFQRAVVEDSTFALAHYRLAVAAGWQGRQELAASATAAALRHSGRLAERDRRLLQAYDQYRKGAVDQAEQGFRDLVRDYPDDLEAEFQLADLLVIHNPIRGRSQEEARDLFDKVLAYDPGFL